MSLVDQIVEALFLHPVFELVVVGVEITHYEKLVVLLEVFIDKFREVIAKEVARMLYCVWNGFRILRHVN